MAVKRVFALCVPIRSGLTNNIVCPFVGQGKQSWHFPSMNEHELVRPHHVLKSFRVRSRSQSRFLGQVDNKHWRRTTSTLRRCARLLLLHVVQLVHRLRGIFAPLVGSSFQHKKEHVYRILNLEGIKNGCVSPLKFCTFCCLTHLCCSHSLLHLPPSRCLQG